MHTKPQGRHECAVELSGSNDYPFKEYIPTCARVMDDNALETAIERVSGGGADAHVAHGPADDPAVKRRCGLKNAPTGGDDNES